jgi:hypothetical protein
VRTFTYPLTCVLWGSFSWCAAADCVMPDRVCSLRVVCSPQQFCANYRDSDGKAVNVREQQDANEFVLKLFDRIEQRLKSGTPSSTARVVADTFTGVFANQIVCDVCQNVSERDEPFYTMPVAVRNQKSLEQSLRSFITGEKLSGGNRVLCSRCGQKQDATKRICIKALPSHTLVVNLKRFDMNYENWRKFKLNEPFEFPHKLNLYPYTREALTPADAKSPPATGAPPTAPVDQTPYQFELVGIVVHTGSAEGGHYYSFIRERLPTGAAGAAAGKPATKSAAPSPSASSSSSSSSSPSSSSSSDVWFEFNDSEVRPFSPESIPSACFGGVHPADSKESNAGKVKENNAYLLFYQRVQQPTAQTAHDEVPAAAPAATAPQMQSKQSADSKTPAAAAAAAPTDLSSINDPLRRRLASLNVPMNPLIARGIWAKNCELARLRNVFDLKFFDFMWDFTHQITPDFSAVCMHAMQHTERPSLRNS